MTDDNRSGDVIDLGEARRQRIHDIHDARLEAMRDALVEQCSSQVTELQTRFGAENIEYLPAEPMVEIQYPVEQYPEKVK